MERLVCIICIIVSYFFGTFETAYFIGKARHIDIRKKGSGNLGSTNVFRVLGVKYGIITFACDLAKVFLAEYLCYIVAVLILHFPIPRIPLFLYSGLGCVLGHDFPVFLRFKGGKGVAASVACLISLWDWKLILLGLIVFFSIAFITKYVSLASMCLIVSEFIAFVIFTSSGLLSVDEKWLPDCYIILGILTVLCIFLHRKNIKRLLNGEENKFRFKKSSKISNEPDN